MVQIQDCQQRSSDATTEYANAQHFSVSQDLCVAVAGQDSSKAHGALERLCPHYEDFEFTIITVYATAY